MERWLDIPDFPDYQISERGLVYSLRRQRILRASPNQKGIYQVGMMQKGIQRKVSVSHLVAEAFVPKLSERFTSVIHFDNNLDHNFVGNLGWRPRGFATSYRKQFEEPYPHRIHQPIRLVQTGEVFADSFEAAKAFGLLEQGVVLSAYNFDVEIRVFPLNYVFEVV